MIRRVVDASWAPTVSILILIAAWEFAVSGLGVPAYLLPSPAAVWTKLLGSADTLATNGIDTVIVTLASFAAAIVLGVATAVVICAFRAIERLLLPLIVFSQVVPKVAVAPLLVIWLGFSLKSRVVVAFLICFFPIVIGTVTGLKSVEADLVHLTRQLRASRWQTFWLVGLPSALPQMFAGLKVAITLAVVGAIVAEFVGADSGLGYLLLVANGNFDVALAFSVLVALTVVGVALYGLIELIERLVLPWHISR
ncbi:MAG: ABC transporter permease, partial [Alphaproteobacteria bacterium]|nr:ABC transporter permease [Alphaproteobacteria bacterium]